MNKPTSIWSFNFIAIFITNAVMFFGQFMVGNLLPKYMHEVGIASTVIGVIMSMFSITALGTRPITGPLIDGMNKKTLYISMLALLMAASFGYAIAADSVPLLIAFRLVHGFSMGCSSALALALITDTLPSEKLASGLGVYGMSTILPMAFGPGVGLAVADRFGYPTAFAISAGLVVISIAVSSRLKIAHDASRKIVFKPGNIIARRAVIPASFTLLLSLSRAGMQTFLIIYIADIREIAGISVYFMITAGVLLVSRPLYGKIADKFGIHIALIPSFFFFAATLVLLAFCTQTWQLYLIGVINALGIGPSFSSLQALTMKVVMPNRRGAASTTSFAGLDVGDLLGPTLAGVVVEAVSYQAMFLVSAVPLIACIVFFYLWVKKHHGIPEPGG